MGEMMAIEGIASNLARLYEYHTETNVPYLKSDSKKNTPSDIDVLGISNEGDTLAVECKAFGGPSAYPNWNTARRTGNIREYVGELATNVGRILDPRFDHVSSIDWVWLVYKGFFATEGDHRKSVYKKNRDTFESELEDEFGIRVSLKPSHELFQEMIWAVSIDMDERRSRYESPAMEMVRHLCAIAVNRPQEIEKIQDSLMEISSTH